MRYVHTYNSDTDQYYILYIVSRISHQEPVQDNYRKHWIVMVQLHIDYMYAGCAHVLNVPHLLNTMTH